MSQVWKVTGLVSQTIYFGFKQQTTVSPSKWHPRSISKSAKRSCSVFFVQCMRRDEICGRTKRGCFTTAMHLLTMSWASDSSWLRRRSPYWSNLPIHLILICVIFFFSPSSKGSSRGPIFEGMEVIERAIIAELRVIQEESFQQCDRESWKRALDLMGITLRGESCSLLFGIWMNCLWHRSHYFSGLISIDIL